MNTKSFVPFQWFYLIGLCLIIPIQGKGQSRDYFDRLYEMDLSQLTVLENELKREEWMHLRNEYGLSVGALVTNSFQEEGVNGFVARGMVHANFLKGGIVEKRRQAKILVNKVMIDSLLYGTNHHESYGLFHHWIIYQFNQLKQESILKISQYGEELLNDVKELYYNKLVGYEQVLYYESIIGEYQILQASYADFDSTISNIIDTDSLARISTLLDYDIEITRLLDDLSNDSTLIEAEQLIHQNIDLEFKNLNNSSLNSSVGYDVYRNSPYFSVSFRHTINRKENSFKQAMKMLRSEQLHFQKTQQKKEIANLCYSYQYKQKQLFAFQLKVLKLEEKLRKNEAMSRINETAVSYAYRESQFALLCTQLELIDLYQQMALVLLQIKEKLKGHPLQDYLQENKRNLQKIKRYAGNRYLMDSNYAGGEEIFLDQNEMEVINTAERGRLDHVLEISPAQFDSRSDMEKYILSHIDQYSNVVFTDLNALKKLELESLEHIDTELIKQVGYQQ